MHIELDDVEYQAAEAFKKEHEECSKKYLGAIGGHFKFEVLETSVGNMGGITCTVCEKSKNITNYDAI